MLVFRVSKWRHGVDGTRRCTACGRSSRQPSSRRRSRWARPGIRRWSTPSLVRCRTRLALCITFGADGPRSKHGLVFRSPVINISRDPRWGRIQEVFSEDPFLTGRMGVAYVKGLQGDDPHYLKVAATVKHFAVNNVETNRQRLSAEVDERNLMEYWLPHWKAAIMEGHAQSVMASYNAINGAPDAINKYLLTDILRGQWKFDGFVTDDLGGVNLLVAAHHITEDPVVATAEAIKAGCDSDDVL